MKHVSAVMIGGPFAGQRFDVDPERKRLLIPEFSEIPPKPLDFAVSVSRPLETVHEYRIEQPVQGVFLGVHSSLVQGDYARMWYNALAALADGYCRRLEDDKTIQQREQAAFDRGVTAGIRKARQYQAETDAIMDNARRAALTPR